MIASNYKQLPKTIAKKEKKNEDEVVKSQLKAKCTLYASFDFFFEKYVFV